MISKSIFDKTLKEYLEAINKTTDIQISLKNKGFKLNVDGIFGQETDKQLRAFQKSRGLVVDGIVGPKTLGMLLVNNFKDSEFYCKCVECSKLPSKGIDPNLLILLEKIRTEVNKKYPLKDKEKGVIINSGYRCPSYNKKVGGATNSQHMSNPLKAADIRVIGVTPKQLGEIADRLNPNGGVGLGGKNIIHVDVRGHKARWYY